MLLVFLVAFSLCQVVNLRKKLAALGEKQVVARKESSKGEVNLVKLQEELLVKLKETKKLNVRRTPLSAMLEENEKKL